MAARDLYAVLGVAPTSTADELKTAYRDLAKQHHPDRFRAYVQKLAATRRLQEINAAYAELRDARRRQAYDRARTRVRASARWRAGRAPHPTYGLSCSLTRAQRVGLVALLVLGWIAAYWVIHTLAPELLGERHPVRDLILSAVIAPALVVFGGGVAAGAVLGVGFVVLAPVAWLLGTWSRARERPARVRRDLGLRVAALGLAAGVLAAWALDVDGAAVLLPVLWTTPLVAIDTAALIAYAVWSRRIVAATAVARALGAGGP
ncbi:MAG: J domain-containing protein [Candidatus Rokuibacteriota bacterium]